MTIKDFLKKYHPLTSKKGSRVSKYGDLKQITWDTYSNIEDIFTDNDDLEPATKMVVALGNARLVLEVCNPEMHDYKYLTDMVADLEGMLDYSESLYVKDCWVPAIIDSTKTGEALSAIVKGFNEETLEKGVTTPVYKINEVRRIEGDKYKAHVSLLNNRFGILAKEMIEQAEVGFFYVGLKEENGEILPDFPQDK